MGAAAMLGIISIIALLVWGLCRILNRKKVVPGGLTEDQQATYQST
jgi:hypothetical protein